MPEERELDGLKREMEKLADHLAALEGLTIDGDAVGDILRELMAGATAVTIIGEFDLVTEFDEGA